METGFEKLWNSKEFRRFSSLRRWNGLITNQQESVIEHSFIVTLFSRFIAESLFKGDSWLILKITTKALLHDFDEAFTGDIPHNIKHDKELGSEIRKPIDEFARRELSKLFPNSSVLGELMNNNVFEDKEHGEASYVKIVVKLCDWLSMLLFLEREVKLGNEALGEHMIYCRENVEKTILSLEKTLIEQKTNYKVKILKDILNTIKNG